MPNPTACLLIIGNEVLSGRTQDANLKFIATRLGEIGIPLREVRVIPDVPETIIGTVNEVRAKYDHVFTTGGIGPTHDDITSECIAAAFGVPWEPQPEAWRRLETHYARLTPPGDFNTARQRMATMPRGATLIVSAAVHANGLMEGRIAEGLAEIQKRYPELDIGSYPYYRAGGGGVAVVAKGTDAAMAKQAARDVLVFMRACGGQPIEGEPG